MPYLAVDFRSVTSRVVEGHHVTLRQDFSSIFTTPEGGLPAFVFESSVTTSSDLLGRGAAPLPWLRVVWR